MQPKVRLVGVAYVVLLLSWIIQVALILPSAKLGAYLRIPGVVERMAELLLAPAAGLLISFWFVRRGRFWGAALALVLCVTYALGDLACYGVSDFYFWRPALRGIRWPPRRTDSLAHQLRSSPARHHPGLADE